MKNWTYQNLRELALATRLDDGDLDVLGGIILSDNQDGGVVDEQQTAIGPYNI